MPPVAEASSIKLQDNPPEPTNWLAARSRKVDNESVERMILLCAGLERAKSVSDEGLWIQKIDCAC